MKRLYVICMAVGVAVATQARGASRTVSSVTDGNWEDASSWVEMESGQNTVPTSEDTVVIDSHRIVLTGGEQVAGFQMKSGTLDLGRHHLNTGGQGFWGRGMIIGTGGFNNRGNLRLDDTPTKTLRGVLNNYNTVTHDQGNLNLAYSSVLVNRGEATYDLTSDANITGLLRWDASPRIINEGIFRKSAGSATSRVEVVFNNVGGTVQVDSGTLSIVGTGGEGSISSNGTFEVAREAVLDLAGNNVNVFNGAYTGSGEGIIQLRAGTLKLATDFNDVTFGFQGGGFSWTGGSIEPVMGALVNEGLITIDGRSLKNFGESPEFRNAGRVVHKGTGALNIEYGGTCRNEKTGVYDIQSDVVLYASGGQGPKPVFDNAGTFLKTRSQGMASVRTPFSNEGEVEVRDGMLNFSDSYVQKSGVTRLRGGNLAASSALDIKGGILAGAGRIFASVMSSGVVTPGNSAGIMAIYGNYSQDKMGQLQMELGGTVAGESYDQLQVNGTARLRGSLDVVLMDGYEPAVGDVYDLVQCTRCDVDFTSVTLPVLVGDVNWDLRYESDGVRLFVVPNGDH